METFDPVKYSLEENQFFLQHLGESPVAALQDALPTGVAPVGRDSCCDLRDSDLPG